MNKIILALALLTVPALADEPPGSDPNAPVAVIRPADLNDVGRIIHEELPPRYGQMVAAWVNGLTARYKAEQEAYKKQNERKEP